MITALNEKVFHFRGLTSDLTAKKFPVPIKQIGNGSTFLAMDTSVLYIYNKATDEWPEYTLSGGGGGGEGPKQYLRSAEVDGTKLKLVKQNGTVIAYQPTDNNYTDEDKAKVLAIPENPKYTDTTYTGTDGINVTGTTLSVLVDNTTIGLNSSGQLSVLGGSSYSAGTAIDISTDNKINLKYDEDKFKIVDGKLSIVETEVTTKETISKQTAASNEKALEDGDPIISRVVTREDSQEPIIADVGDYIYTFLD